MSVLRTQAVFVTNRSYIEATGGGGVQRCTREYLDMLASAGFEVELVEYDVDRRLPVRARRRFLPRPYADVVPPYVVERAESARRASRSSWVFLNNAEPLGLASQLMQASNGEARIVYLSHGAEITDHINALRLAPEDIRPQHASPTWLGRMLHAEIEVRRTLTAVVCLSREDVAIERLLGANAVCFIPRTAPRTPITRSPVAGRIGTVSTLNHTPNCHGIQQYAAALEKVPGGALRLVGRPASIGREMAGRFRCVEYVGELSERELVQEAGTWSAFVNPIFCPARGASTKIAQALGWGIPVVTTPEGARGYRWSSDLPLATSPEQLAVNSVHAAGAGASEWSAATLRTASLAPTTAENGNELKGFLDGLVGAGPEEPEPRG